MITGMDLNAEYGFFVLCSAIGILFMHTDALIRPQPPWINHRYQFYIHNISKSWDDARAICMSSGSAVSLLTVHDERAWNMWRHLLGPSHQDTGKYWFGLTGANSSLSGSIWTGCEVSPFMTPLVEDFETSDGNCIYMWIQREVFIDVFQDKWFFGQDCNSNAHFICSVYVPDRFCFPRTCNDIIVPAISADCTDSLCHSFQPAQTCNYDFLEPQGFCHLWISNPDTQATVRTICFLPDIHDKITYCPEVNVTVNYTAGVDNIEDNCPVYTKVVDVSGLFDFKYYLYYTRGTSWNSAREICRLQNGTLLTLLAYDLEKWRYLLDAIMLIDDEPWVGLHVPDLSPPLQFFWDDCSRPSFEGPSGPLNVSCVKFTSHGMVPAACNESHPFICEFDLTGSSCQSSTCEETILFINETDCDVSLCTHLYDSCTITYFPTERTCQLLGNVSGNSTASCIVPKNVSQRCNGTTYVSDVYFTDPDSNLGVTDDKCLVPSSTPTFTTATASEPQLCSCDCTLMLPFLQAPTTEEVKLTIEEKIEKIISELTVDRKNTTLNRMKYISATDNRPSSVGLGAVAGGIIFSVFGVIVLMDLSRLFHDIQRFIRKLLSFLQLKKVHNTDASAASETTSTIFSDSTVSSLVYSDTGVNYDNRTSGIFELNSFVCENIPPAATSLE